MKRWYITTEISQNLTSFDVLRSSQISKFAKDERKKFAEEHGSNKLNKEKPLIPVDTWVIKKTFRKLKERYSHIDGVKIIKIEIKRSGNMLS